MIDLSIEPSEDTHVLRPLEELIGEKLLDLGSGFAGREHLRRAIKEYCANFDYSCCITARTEKVVANCSTKTCPFYVEATCRRAGELNVEYIVRKFEPHFGCKKKTDRGPYSFKELAQTILSTGFKFKESELAWEANKRVAPLLEKYIKPLNASGFNSSTLLRLRKEMQKLALEEQQ